MRLTRAAAAAAQIHVDDPDPAPSIDTYGLSPASTSPAKDARAPLGEVSSNSLVEHEEGRDILQQEGSAEPKLCEQSADDQNPDVLPDGLEAESSDASDAAAEDLKDDDSQ